MALNATVETRLGHRRRPTMAARCITMLYISLGKLGVDVVEPHRFHLRCAHMDRDLRLGDRFGVAFLRASSSRSHRSRSATVDDFMALVVTV
jgi:hypothetical protein